MRRALPLPGCPPGALIAIIVPPQKNKLCVRIKLLLVRRARHLSRAAVAAGGEPVLAATQRRHKPRSTACARKRSRKMARGMLDYLVSNLWL